MILVKDRIALKEFNQHLENGVYLQLGSCQKGTGIYRDFNKLLCVSWFSELIEFHFVLLICTNMKKLNDFYIPPPPCYS